LREESQVLRLFFCCQIEPCGLCIHPDYPYLAASPDARVSCDCCGERVIEIKCPYNCSVESGKESKIEDLPWMPLTTRSDYYYQMQVEMLCAGVESCDFIVWAEKEHRVTRFTRNIETCNEIVNKCKEYFHNAVIPELLAKYHTRARKKRTIVQSTP